MTITVSYVQDDKDGYSMSTKMEYTITAEGISIPTSNELIIRDVKYDGNTPVSATVESRVLEQNATIVSEGLTYTVNTSNISLFYLDTQTPTLNVNIMQQSDTAVAGQTVSQSAQIDLMLKQRSLNYMAAQNSVVYSEVSGENVTLAAPEDAVIPQIVYDLADKAYYDIVQ